MCGILFVYQVKASAEELRARGSRALKRMVHRGPDEQGMVCEPPLFMGHRRLSIIDLEASRQPMTDASGRYTLTYNGEVYNYKELKRELASRWRFETSGDTEVVLAGLVIEGVRFLKKMEGMWALALWDRTEQALILARDRMGKKPLYYQTSASHFACASELPALAQVTQPLWDEDLDSTADYLRYGFYLPGTTAFKDVQEVLAGHFLRWTPCWQPETQPYWSLSVGGFTGTRQQAGELLREKLTNAVKRRLVADVEVGAFLSGGVDSSLIVSILAKVCGVSPKTFTIGFNDATYDERAFARQVARDCNTIHYDHCVDTYDAERLKTLILDHVGQPFADSSLLPTTLVSSLAAQHVKVALSGDGGDELFSGYQRYQARVLLRWYTRLPHCLRVNTERLIRSLPEPMAHHSRSLLKKAHLFQDVVDRLRCEQPFVSSVLYSDEHFAHLAPDLVGRGHAAPCLPAVSEPDDIQAMMTADALVYLPQDILTKVDRASMASSVEARAPFLDREVVELAFSLPRSWHRRYWSGKRMLHETFANLLPASVWRRCKQGFGVPIHSWFRQQLGSELEDLLIQTRTPVNGEQARAMLNAHRRRARDPGYRLWNIYVYLLWQQRKLKHVS